MKNQHVEAIKFLKPAGPGLPAVIDLSNHSDFSKFQDDLAAAFETAFPQSNFEEAITRTNSQFGFSVILVPIVALAFESGRRAGETSASIASIRATAAATTAQPPKIKTFAEAVSGFVGLGVSQSAAVALVVKDFPELHGAYLKSGGGPLVVGTDSKPTKGNSGEKTFASLVAAQVASGQTKGEAIKAVMASHPEAYARYLQSGGGKF